MTTMKYQIQTYSGQLVDYLNPNPDTILIEDIAKSLSQECRFGSQSRIFYSVATHSITVCGYAPLELKLEALLHDAEEAYLKDMPTPLIAAISRGAVSQYRNIKSRIRAAIAAKFKLKFHDWYNLDAILSDERKLKTNWDIIKEIDKRMAVTERNHLFKNPQPLFEGEDIEPYGEGSSLFLPCSMIETEKKFLDMFELYRRDKSEETS